MNIGVAASLYVDLRGIRNTSQSRVGRINTNPHPYLHMLIAITDARNATEGWPTNGLMGQSHLELGKG